MADYTLYYWPAPFRGQFVRAVLAHIGASWDEAGIEETFAQRAAEPGSQLIPHMGPPVLTDHCRGIHISQMPAILTYLGEQYGLMGSDPALKAQNQKIIGDANDVLYEMTRHNGTQLWTGAAWTAFEPRLARWMSMFEETGLRHGLTAGSGYLLGTSAPGLADLVTTILWGTMTTKFAPLRLKLDTYAPTIAGLCDRMGAFSQQADLRSHSDALYGDVWCGGEIEASLRAVVSKP